MEHLLGVTAEVTSLLSILAAVGSPLEPGFWNGMSWHVWGVVVYNCITHVDRQGGNLEIIGTTHKKNIIYKILIILSTFLVAIFEGVEAHFIALMARKA